MDKRRRNTSKINEKITNKSQKGLAEVTWTLQDTKLRFPTEYLQALLLPKSRPLTQFSIPILYSCKHKLGANIKVKTFVYLNFFKVIFPIKDIMNFVNVAAYEHVLILLRERETGTEPKL